MKGMISMILIGALALTLSGCHAPVDAAATAQTRETTVPTAAETQPGTSPAGIERPEPEDADFVRVRDYLPDVLQELPYASTENFTGHRIYEFTEVFLRYGTVKKLQAALLHYKKYSMPAASRSRTERRLQGSVESRAIPNRMQCESP